MLSQFVCIEADSEPLISESSGSEALDVIEHKIAELKDLMAQDQHQEDSEADEISLHTISKLFLPSGAYQIFDILVIATLYVLDNQYHIYQITFLLVKYVLGIYILTSADILSLILQNSR